jgi:hypothetical protein
MNAGQNGKGGIDRVADAAMPQVDETNVSERSAWWWILFMPGKVLLWVEYMFPRGVGGAFGSARRRNVPMLQVYYTLCVYLFVVCFVLLAWVLSK